MDLAGAVENELGKEYNTSILSDQIIEQDLNKLGGRTRIGYVTDGKSSGSFCLRKREKTTMEP